MPVVFSYKLQYFKVGAFAHGDFLKYVFHFKIWILSHTYKAKKTNILITYAVWRTLKYSMLHSTEKKDYLRRKNKNKNNNKV